MQREWHTGCVGRGAVEAERQVDAKKRDEKAGPAVRFFPFVLGRHTPCAPSKNNAPPTQLRNYHTGVVRLWL